MATIDERCISNEESFQKVVVVTHDYPIKQRLDKVNLHAVTFLIKSDMYTIMNS